jgi:OmpA-OmpF porin, OOP family
MKKVVRLSVMAAIAGVASFEATVARAQELPGPYIGLGVGPQWLEGLSANGPFGGTTSLNYNVGPVGTVAGGYALGNGFRAELEFGYRHSEAKNITVPSGATLPTSLNLKTNAGAYSYMANGLYDFRLLAPWSAYIGAGVGAADVRINNVGHDFGFAYQAMTGVEYGLTPQMKLGLGYKFLGTEGLKLSSNPFFNAHPSYDDHALLVTFRYTFGHPPPPPHPAAIVPMPAPQAGTTAPPPLNRDFTIYFATGSAVLSPDAREIVRAAATTAKDNGPAHINVSGHTDTVASQSYNEKLSARRAAAVRKELVADGVPADEIATAALGESDLAVPTANEVPEARNRRVVITVQGPGT